MGADTVGTIAAWAAAAISFVAFCWALVVFALGRIGDNRIAGNSVLVELVGTTLVVYNFGDHPVRSIALSVNGKKVTLRGRTPSRPDELVSRTFLESGGSFLTAVELESTTDGKLDAQLSYSDARGRWWQQSPGRTPKRLWDTPAAAMRRGL